MDELAKRYDWFVVEKVVKSKNTCDCCIVKEGIDPAFEVDYYFWLIYGQDGIEFQAVMDFRDEGKARRACRELNRKLIKLVERSKGDPMKDY